MVCTVNGVLVIKYEVKVEVSNQAAYHLSAVSSTFGQVFESAQ